MQNLDFEFLCLFFVFVGFGGFLADGGESVFVYLKEGKSETDDDRRNEEEKGKIKN